MEHLLVYCLLVATLGSVAAFPRDVSEAKAEGKLIARRLLKPISRSIEVVENQNAEVGKFNESLKVSDELPVRVPRSFAIQDPNAQNESDVSFDTRLKNSVAHGEASQERPTTMAVKEEEKKLKAAWMKYANPPHTAQPMVAQCSAILQGARSEFAKSHCSLEFHENLELCLKAEPYCKFFNKDFVTSVTDIETQADKWCGKTDCEASVEQLEEIEKDCMDVASAKPAELLTYIKEHRFRFEYPKVRMTMPEFAASWEASGCFAKVCTTLEQQAAQVNAAYITYEKMDSSYASFANEVKLEGLVLYDLYTVAGCK